MKADIILQGNRRTEGDILYEKLANQHERGILPVKKIYILPVFSFYKNVGTFFCRYLINPAVCQRGTVGNYYLMGAWFYSGSVTRIDL